MTRPRRVASLLAWTTALISVLTACSGVPDTSLPQVVKTVDGTGLSDPTETVRPEAGDEPRQTVSKFLQAQLSNDESHQTARAFLSEAGASKWQDSTVTIVDEYRVGDIGPNNQLQVSARQVGSLNSNGIYTPTLEGLGLSEEKQFTFTLVQTSGGWRITDPPNGLIVRERDFASSFRRRVLYFFDQSETRLVPDLRYSPLAGQSLASWMLGQLLSGPQQQQQSALRDEFPDQVDQQRAKVTLTDPIVVQLPGLSQPIADSGALTRIAAELAYSFRSFDSTTPITLFDGTRQITLANGASTFQADDFPQYESVPPGRPELYFLRDNRILTGTGQPVNGRGASQVALTSVAVAGAAGTDVRLAGVTAQQPTTLHVGTANTGLVAIALSGGPITARPDWVASRPDQPATEVWVGEGQALVRVVGTQPIPVPLLGDRVSLSTKSIQAVRVAPDGTRIALVLADATTSSVYVGVIVRDNQSVQVEGLQQVTPAGWSVRDVGWGSDGLALRAVGTTSGSQIETWALSVDGSLPSEPNTENLPGQPDAVAATSDGTVWLSVQGSVWRENPLGGWDNPFATAVDQKGSAPVFAAP
jgi:hypothetical protein